MDLKFCIVLNNIDVNVTENLCLWLYDVVMFDSHYSVLNNVFDIKLLLIYMCLIICYDNMNENFK